ncbi:MAG TPA: hypothetical protein VJC11_01855 [Patescibacteria group bacterium]|nr:hypothetical protein [Patescibacteria group bacterium]
MNTEQLLTRAKRREQKTRKPKMKISGRRVKNLAKLIREKAKK